MFSYTSINSHSQVSLFCNIAVYVPKNISRREEQMTKVLTGGQS